jgi:hypothetical protein
MAGRCGGGAGRNAGAVGRAMAGGGAGRAMAGGGAGRAIAGGGAGRAMAGGAAGRAAAGGAGLLCSWAYEPLLAAITETLRRNTAKRPPGGSMSEAFRLLFGRPLISTLERSNRSPFAPLTGHCDVATQGDGASIRNLLGCRRCADGAS